MEGTIQLTGISVDDFFSELEKRYKQKPMTITKVDEAPLNAQGAAKYLGRSLEAIYVLVNREEIPFYKKLGRLYFYKNELDDWIRSGKNERLEDIIAKAHATMMKKKRKAASTTNQLK